MRTSWKKLVHHVGIKYGQEIINELSSKIKVNLITLVHSAEVLLRHATREALVHMGQYKIEASRRAQASMLKEASTAEPSDAEMAMKIATLDNKIAKGDYDLADKIPIYMSESEKTAYENGWRTYKERNSNLGKHKVQVYSLILG